MGSTKEKIRKRLWYIKNKTRLLNNAKIRYQKNKAIRYEKQKIWNAKNRERLLAKRRAWKKANPGKNAADTALRRARLRNATPRWTNLKDIENFYTACSKGYHVDHIIPLAGKNVCGLHVRWNLQYLPAKENQRKGNKL